MMNFFSNIGKPAAPKLSQKQLLNQMYHNALNEKAKVDAENYKQQYQTNQSFRAQVEQRDKELSAALASNNQDEIEKVIRKKLKEQIDKQKAERERIIKL